MKTVNVAVQIIPIVTENQVNTIVDKAIDVIDKSGIKYKVCPFETVLEGNVNEIFETIKLAQAACYKAGAKELITNIKIHSNIERDLKIADKMEKYS